MSFKLEKFNFIKATKNQIKEYTILVNNGLVNEFEINKKFEEIKKNKYYSEEEAVFIIQNLTIASFLVPYERTDFQVPCGEALIYVSQFIEIEGGSINLKILYALFRCLVVVEKDENNKRQYSFTNLTGKEIYPDLLIGYYL